MKNIQNAQIKHASQYPISILPNEQYNADLRHKVKQQMRILNVQEEPGSDQPASILELSPLHNHSVSSSRQYSDE